MSATYWQYWGKAKPLEAAVRYHLLAYHCLDVAAVGDVLLQRLGLALDGIAAELGLSVTQFRALLVFFLVLHDLGKFARVFQLLAKDLSPDLVAGKVGQRCYTQRHDTLGCLLWQQALVSQLPPGLLADPANGYWADWIKIVTGHHGMPPKDERSSLLIANFFVEEDIGVAAQFVAEVASLLLPAQLPAPGKPQRQALQRHGWVLAGLAVLADWLGSDQQHFPYHDRPTHSLADYWQQVALPAAARAVAAAGVGAHAVAPFPGAAHLTRLFHYLHEPTPLQHHAASVPLGTGPQLFLLEDVTGAGKTEAALILAHRLMAQRLAHGFYFGLPTMATANQMYQRVGNVYRGFYQGGERPSIVLAHGARDLIADFQQSIQPQDRGYAQDEPSATLQCNAWLADNRKKALLADIGVGSIDQALLAALPVRHQALRLLGLARKVLIIDEVHAYDPYMTELLEKLLAAHARQGGSAILLSATVPASTRARLLSAFQRGLGIETPVPPDTRYPLASQIKGDVVETQACATREQVKRRVAIKLLHDEADVLALIREQVAAGRCVGWIRNTVEDCRNAYRALQAALPEDQLILFHSQFAMGHRLDIENRVLAALGKASTENERHGRVIVGSQVIEQSLDIDVDVLITDLAPIDLLIQRAGRLQRHVRDAYGNPAQTEQRPAPVLYVYGPVPAAEPGVDWYGSVFPKGQYVYPDIGQLWLAQRALLQAGCIVSPGEPGQPGAVRQLVEAVYGDEAQEQIPEALLQASSKCAGEAMSERSLASFNAIDFGKGYTRSSSVHWGEEARIPTRLGDETKTVYLAVLQDGELVPLYQGEKLAWPLSAAKLRALRVKGLSNAWEQRFAEAIAAARSRYPLLEEPALVLPLVPDEQGRWCAELEGGDSSRGWFVYDIALGGKVER